MLRSPDDTSINLGPIPLSPPRLVQERPREAPVRVRRV